MFLSEQCESTNADQRGGAPVRSTRLFRFYPRSYERILLTSYIDRRCRIERPATMNAF